MGSFSKNKNITVYILNVYKYTHSFFFLKFAIFKAFCVFSQALTNAQVI